MKSKANTSKRKPQPANQLRGEVVGACDTSAKPRRSIPIAEVHKIVQREIENVKSKLTIYDDRLAVLAQLEVNESDLEYLNARVHETQIQNKQLRADLARVNLAITRQLELDGE